VKKRAWHVVEVAEDGQLKIPPELAAQFGIKAGEKVVLEVGANELLLRRSVSRLARIYVETTNTCNLGCRTCIRNVWDEPAGWMSEATFQRVLEGLEDFSPRPTVFFGGFGEPLSHPHIIEMIRQVKALGAPVELITNGVYLNEQMAEKLVEAELDLLWVSIDGADPDSYADVRLGAELPGVLENIRQMRRLQDRRYREKPQLGFAYVAMQRNIRELPGVLKMGARLGAEHFSISNVLAHTPELKQEELYQRSMYDGAYQSSSGLPEVNFPRMDIQPDTLAALGEILSCRYRVKLAGCEISSTINRCPFVEKGSTAIRWDGSLSPCLPLLHTHESYLGERLRHTREYLVGSLHERKLVELWNDPCYTALRERLQEYDFSPCTFCNSCEMADSNQEDCFGNLAPACGGCLWAQGLIQCP
jgi:MoaA/NifB/PqqE/SkfB family radical SAM enzyme